MLNCIQKQEEERGAGRRESPVRGGSERRGHVEEWPR